MQYKNCEGYSDPTARIALMRVSRQEERERKIRHPLPMHLTFKIGELKSFKRWIKGAQI